MLSRDRHNRFSGPRGPRFGRGFGWLQILGFISGLLIALSMLLAVAAPASAGPPGTEQPADPNSDASDSDGFASTFRGTSVSFEQSLAHRTFQPDGQLTYDPYYNLELEARPQWWPSDDWYVAGRFSISQELTHSNVTTRKNELWPSDTRLTAGAPSVWQIPGAEINVATGGGLILPTSKPSQARTLLVGVEGRLGLSRRFELLDGLTVSYSGRVQKRFHRYRTSELESPRIPACSDLERGCDPFLTTGIRNPAWRQSHLGTISVRPIDKLTVAATGGVYVDHLYPANDVSVSYDGPLQNANTRHTNLWILDVGYQATSWMSVSAGFRTISPQLAPDSTYYAPVFNRYAEWTADVGVDLPALVSTF